MLKVHTEKLGEITVLHLQGRIVIGETKVLLNAVLSQSDASVVVLNLARVTGVDAHGLGVLLELRERTQSKGIEFRLVNVTRLVGQVLEITCLNTVFEASLKRNFLEGIA
jgi:anti-anti-sigma factor